MAGFSFTPAQKAAVSARGSAILVSAAAGSGKTRVLVERLLSYVTDPDDPRDIDSFLIITYTRAAAAELRGRILEEIDRRAAKNPQDRRLRRQSALCQRARIGTIHNFCTTVLREHAHELGIPPAFRVADTDRAEAIRINVLEKLMDIAYESINEKDGFRLLVDTVGAGRDDRRLEEVVLELHAKMQSQAWPEEWAREQSLLLDMKGAGDITDTKWGAELMKNAVFCAKYWSGELGSALADIYAPGNEKMAKAYGESFSQTAEGIGAFLGACEAGWDSARKYLPVLFPRLGGLRNFEDEELLNRVKSRRDACKKAMTALEDEFSADSVELMRELSMSAPAMKALLEITLEFDRRFSAEKLRQGLLDFSDLEHWAARLLVDPKTGEATQAARELSRSFTEIMVDEYQDVNAVQDMLFSAVSKDEKNLFMVGDVKQSIYRFRLADPTIFIEKYDRFADFDFNLPVSLTGEPRRILLRQNFRSRACVLEAANHVFKNTMSRELGELDYDEAASLIAGADYPAQGEVSTQLYVIDMPEGAEDDDAPDKTEVEARFVAGKIRELVDSGAPVFEGGKTRPVSYGDIVILMRSPGRPGAVWRRALLERGIPVASGQSGGFFSSVEISIMLSILAVIDNPHQDIPLISALRSPVFGFTADELSEIRAVDKNTDFFTALKIAANESEKCRGFLDRLEELREAAPDMTVDMLVWHIFSCLDVPAICGAMSDGAARLENLFLLHELARAFESGGYRGLFRFNEQLGRMMERGEEPSSGGAQSGDCLRIMSIHKSKGLEFPYVFLADTARQFNKQDSMKTVLVHSELGLGAKYTDLERGLEYPTAARRAIAGRIISEGLSEELRGLYVAMTRAKEGLFVTCALRRAGQAVERLKLSLSSPLAVPVLTAQRSFAQWLILCTLLPDSPIRLELCSGQDKGGLFSEEEIEAEGKFLPRKVNSELLNKISKQLDFRYADFGSAAVPSKLTATELKDRFEDENRSEEAKVLVSQMAYSFRRPDFSAPVLDAAGRGTATHLAMQHIDFEKTSSAEELGRELDRLISSGRLRPEQAEAVDVGSVLEFFRSDLGRRLLTADEVFREFRFSLLVPARMYYPRSAEGEEILLQGVTDCCMAENGQLTILDFKTDRLTKAEIPKRTEIYKPQLAAYKYAMERILSMPVEETVLCFLSCGELVYIK